MKADCGASEESCGEAWDIVDAIAGEGDEGVADGDETGDDFGKGLCDAGSAENAVDVPDRLERVWSMFRSDWITDCLSNLSRTEMVLTTSSKE